MVVDIPAVQRIGFSRHACIMCRYCLYISGQSGLPTHTQILMWLSEKESIMGIDIPIIPIIDLPTQSNAQVLMRYSGTRRVGEVVWLHRKKPITDHDTQTYCKHRSHPMVLKFIKSDHIYSKAIRCECNMEKKNAETSGPLGDLGSTARDTLLLNNESWQICT